LTTPLSRRVRQIELTLERWRWLAASQQRPDIVVNIPQFMLYTLPPAHQSEALTLEMPVIVGRSYTSTPVFMAQIDEVVFQPYWDVPSSILRKELLPKIRKNPDYLERHHFEIVRGGGDDATIVEPDPAAIDALASGRLRLRQRPGADNALGPVKFVLPNAYGIRLHGTSEPALFELPSRAFSHGCIRVSQPADLAEFVLQHAPDKWDADRVETAMCGTQTLRVKLATPVRVVVFYATAVASESRGALFSEDIYGLDRKLEQLLDLRPKDIS
jgi:murein L,D-transpeptidase YcbB/YkuD